MDSSYGAALQPPLAGAAVPWQEDPSSAAMVGCKAGHPRAILAAVVQAVDRSPNELDQGALVWGPVAAAMWRITTLYS